MSGVTGKRFVVEGSGGPIGAAIIDELRSEGAIEQAAGADVLVVAATTPAAHEDPGAYVGRTLSSAADAVTRLFRSTERPGSIVLVGISAGAEAAVGFTAAGAVNGMLRGVSRAWAVELGDIGVRCNVVLPGLIVFGEGTVSGTDAPLARAPLVRDGSTLGSPQDIAKAVVFLASDDSAYITGTEIDVDGGLSGTRASIFSDLWARGLQTATHNPFAPVASV